MLCAVLLSAGSGLRREPIRQLQYDISSSRACIADGFKPTVSENCRASHLFRPTLARAVRADKGDGPKGGREARCKQLAGHEFDGALHAVTLMPAKQ